MANILIKSVPLYTTCKGIPEGEFSACGLVWRGCPTGIELTPRECAGVCPIEETAILAPAPTIEEISERFCELGYEPVTVTRWRTGQWTATCQKNGSEGEQVSTINGADALLDLYLWVEGKEDGTQN